MQPQMAVKSDHLDTNVHPRMCVSQRKLTIPRYKEGSEFDLMLDTCSVCG